MTILGKVFQNGRSQAIRIPKEFRVDCDEVYIEKVDNTLIIKPKESNKWDNFFSNLEKIDTSDFLSARKQPKTQERDLF